MIFQESQPLSQPWLVVLMASVTLLLVALFAFGLYRQLWLGIPFGSRPVSNAGLVIISVCCLGVVGGLDYFLLGVSMTTEVRSDAVEVFIPHLMPRPARFQPQNIRSATVRSYDAIAEYGGWGIRGSAASRAYTARGDRGVQLELTDGSHVLIGSSAPERLAEAIASILEPP